MELYVAGGVKEHGRNCFMVIGQSATILVDCGIKADNPEDQYPHLSLEHINKINVVFLTHSHNDHSGAIEWLYKNGFNGYVVATRDTIKQLSFKSAKYMLLEDICPRGKGKLYQYSIEWGQSGHCKGSVWYYFTEGNKSILFSGDYTENTYVYNFNPIRNKVADMAVIDCAYGKDNESYQKLSHSIVEMTKRLLIEHKAVLFPVPKYGRGLEIFKLLSEQLDYDCYYADKQFIENFKDYLQDNYWFKANKITKDISLYNGQKEGIVFVSDPQLRNEYSQLIAQELLSIGAKAIMTGTIEKGSFSEELIRQGNMVNCRYPVHLNYLQFQKLKKHNSFIITIPFHSKEMLADLRYKF